mmetsp:Transcript_15750/g.23690  ORF Transcript_15750/g.23690 Transcript_15750/m.23690 type:complete len:198 (-) Transcript_15750:839-1432(-)
MTLPKLYRDGTPQLDSKGFELSFSQHGTNFAENTFGRAERVMSAHGGYNADVFSALGYEFASRSNTDARRSLLGEQDTGHCRYDIIAQIEKNYKEADEPCFYDWYVEPQEDDDRRYRADYHKQLHPELWSAYVDKKILVQFLLHIYLVLSDFTQLFLLIIKMVLTKLKWIILLQIHRVRLLLLKMKCLVRQFPPPSL